MINKFSKIVEIFSPFNIRVRDLTSGNRKKLSLVAINSAWRRCNLLIPYVFCKKIRNLALVTVISPRGQSLRVATAIAWISVVPPFIWARIRSKCNRPVGCRRIRAFTSQWHTQTNAKFAQQDITITGVRHYT